MILTDNRSYMSPPADAGPFSPDSAPYMTDEAASDIIDRGREYGGGHAPATIRFGRQRSREPAGAMRRRKPISGSSRWRGSRSACAQSKAPWKIWGHSFGTLTWRVDPQNLPPPLRAQWPGDGYAVPERGLRGRARRDLRPSCAMQASRASRSSPATSIRSGRAIRARRCRRSRSNPSASSSSRDRSRRRVLPRSPRRSSRRIIPCARSTSTTGRTARCNARSA